MAEPKNDASAGQGANMLLKLLRRQRDAYRELQRLADRQRRLIAQDDPSELLTVLGRRQKLTQELVVLGQELAPHREDWSATCVGLDPGDRKDAERMLAEASALLGRIIQDDEQDARLLLARKTQTATQLGTVRGERRAVAAYAATASQAASRLDRICEES